MIYNKESMTMILTEDLNKITSEFDDKIYETVKMNVSYDSLKDKCIENLFKFYELIDTEDSFSLSKRKYLSDYSHTYFDDKTVEFKKRIENRKDIIQKMEILKLLDLPEQRSEEWYKIREGVLTASSLADAIGEGHFCTKEQLLIQKCGGPRGEVPFEIVEWGVKYEPVATSFYEKLNNLTVLEFGLVPHPEFTIFGASPDGICDVDSSSDYIGRMLEIKCPPKRQFTNEVPRHYWMQMQGQLECCNLEECDFLQVKFTEYFSESEYTEDTFNEDGMLKEGYSSLNLPKGLIIAFIKKNETGNPTIRYEYSELGSSYDSIKQWSDDRINHYENSDFKYDILKFNWWRIERYECTLVGRDRKWWLSVQPKIIDFWEDVLHHREVGIQQLLDAKEEKRTKRIKIKEEKKQKQHMKKEEKKKNTFEIDKAVVEKIQSNYLILSDNE
jgi:putative phage-type endonuclease